MNKSELVDAVASAAGLERRQAEAALTAAIEEIVAQTRAGEQVSLFGFGTFKPSARAARTGRNPQTGAPVKIAASKGVKFQMATAFKATLNAKKAAAKKAAPAKKASATKAPAKTTAAKTTPAKTTPAKTTAARTTAAKSSPSKTAAKVAPAKKAVATKAAPAKKVAAKATTAAKKVVTKATAATKKR